MFRIIIIRRFRSIEIIIIITIILSKICVPLKLMILVINHTHTQGNKHIRIWYMIYLINHLHAIHIQKGNRKVYIDWLINWDYVVVIGDCIYTRRGERLSEIYCGDHLGGAQ